jgi:hypothetical protein
VVSRLVERNTEALINLTSLLLTNRVNPTAGKQKLHGFWWFSIKK